MKKLLLTIAAVVGTFVAGSGTAWAESQTEQLTISSSYAKNDDITGTSFTIKGTFNAERQSDTTYKLRTNQSVTVNEISYSKAVEIDVNTGYAITKLEMTGKTAIKLSAVYVDDDMTNSVISADGLSFTAAGATLTVSGIAATKTIYLIFSGDATQLANFAVKFTYEKVGTVAIPTIQSSYNSETGKYDVTLSCATEGATLTYTYGDQTGSSDTNTATFSADPSAAISVTATLNGDTSQASQTLNGIPTVSAPTYTLTQNAPYRTWKVALASATTGATISYTIGEKTEEYTEAFEVGQGVAITATATMKNYNTSTTTFTTKAYPTTNPASETTTAGVADATQEGFSYTIDGTYIAQNGADKYSQYIKMRTNKTAGIFKSSGFRIVVNEGYTITKIVVRGHSNNSSTAVSIDSVVVDDTVIENFTAASLPVNGSASTTETRLTLSDIAATKTIDFKCTGYTQAIVQFDITFTMPEQIIPITLDETVGFATYYSENALTIPEGVSVYTGKIDGTSLVLTEVKDAVPAKTAVILNGEAGKVVEFTTTSQEVAAIEDNDLKGVTAATDLENVYVLSYKKGTEDVGFYKAEKVTVPANKAYVVWEAATAEETPATGEAPVLRFDFGQGTELGNVTGINAVTIENRTDNVIYDLRGRRVLSLDRPGLYIVNGKKVAIQ
jgi:hypothetical protein